MPNLPWTHRTLFQLVIAGDSLGNQVVNVLHFEASTVKETSYATDQDAINDAGALADDWVTGMMATWRPAHGSEYAVRLITCQVLERPGNFRHRLSPVERPLTTNNNGTANVAAVNPSVSSVLRWRTPIAGKSHRGRMYLGPIPSDWQTNGRLHAIAQGPIGNFGTAHLARYGVGGSQANSWVQTVYSRPYNEGEYQYATRKGGTLHIVTPVDYAGNSTNVTTYVLDTILRVQRRREVGVGS
jgi:hypothetical protein